VKITINKSKNSDVIEVAVVDRTGRLVKVEKHKEPETASMAAKYLSVAFRCPICYE
jgi:hypothetical protein